jgi:hypothetical protein
VGLYWNHGEGLDWCKNATLLQLGLGHDAAGSRIYNSDGREVRFVFAFVVRSAGDARRSGCGRVRPGSLLNLARIAIQHLREINAVRVRA